MLPKDADMVNKPRGNVGHTEIWAGLAKPKLKAEIQTDNNTFEHAVTQ